MLTKRDILLYKWSTGPLFELQESHLDRKFAEFTKKMYMSSFILYMQFKHFTIMRNAFSEASAVVSRQRRL